MRVVPLSRTRSPLCPTDATPADQKIDACNKIIALKVFAGEKPATINFWRAAGWNKKGSYSQVTADATETLRLKSDIALYNPRGSAHYDRGEYDIAISDFNDALQMLTRVRAEEVAATKSRQVPWSNSSLLGEVYLAEK